MTLKIEHRLEKSVRHDERQVGFAVQSEYQYVQEQLHSTDYEHFQSELQLLNLVRTRITFEVDCLKRQYSSLYSSPSQLQQINFSHDFSCLSMSPERTLRSILQKSTLATHNGSHAKNVR
jgi:hypothetical protein